MASVGEVAQRLRAALQGLRPEELTASAASLRNDVLVVLSEAAAETNRAELAEAAGLLASVPDELEAVAALYAQARSQTEAYIQRHGQPDRSPTSTSAPPAVPPAPPSSAGTAPATTAPTQPPAGGVTPSTNAPPPTVAPRGTPATFGWTNSFNHQRTFFAAHPETEGHIWVHHAVERQVLRKFPGVVVENEMHSLENLRGVPKGEVNNTVHLSAIRIAWNRFYRPFLKTGTKPTKQQLLDFATQLDDEHGAAFTPPIRED